LRYWVIGTAGSNRTQPLPRRVFVRLFIETGKEVEPRTSARVNMTLESMAIPHGATEKAFPGGS